MGVMSGYRKFIPGDGENGIEDRWVWVDTSGPRIAPVDMKLEKRKRHAFEANVGEAAFLVYERLAQVARDNGISIPEDLLEEATYKFMMHDTHRYMSAEPNPTAEKIAETFLMRFAIEAKQMSAGGNYPIMTPYAAQEISRGVSADVPILRWINENVLNKANEVTADSKFKVFLKQALAAIPIAAAALTAAAVFIYGNYRAADIPAIATPDDIAAAQGPLQSVTTGVSPDGRCRFNPSRIEIEDGEILLVQAEGRHEIEFREDMPLVLPDATETFRVQGSTAFKFEFGQDSETSINTSRTLLCKSTNAPRQGPALEIVRIMGK